jgi:hypothetical protein
MPLKGRKVSAFIIITIILIAIYFITLFVAPDVLKSIGNTIVVMFFANGITFIGGNTLDKWIKSKYFRSEYFDRENNGG